MVTTLASNLTFEDYLNYDDSTGFHYELVDGKLELMNPPTVEHFLIVDFLDTVLKAEIKRLTLPWLCLRETGLRTSINKSRLTDLCVVSRDQARELMNVSAVFQSPPIMIVEVVSPESVKRDYRYKRSEYAALEVSEYWIVDPIEAKITVLVLEEGLYEQTVFTDKEQIASSIFPELIVTPEQVFQAGKLS
ncbi:Uma2 family endonuclease [Aetokthonos hydrillicola Thurmond2011]|jgi:Uma2 family endonuclease|uniref:Uma2 family endonuclease n=1 Tax=Aetokthonos hydrillicola Thurmond2011 TaxID=2712845 RepID=A0AAP5IBR2_9CYAN|nr:Uma2 family endonuclease [Aetokthonos hydrillicola]MBO3462374.1 Uma2 family endonuclease [Aetokthonos hydrillicola CCALA 1050]MBW4584209.1 Uma2 family endonuclease [Aetokthonos hydrillicola CCALA 1050]MDR9898583.1 Uma2 family endonuclease [Aetokthonos hydrillicola Thurmond2011]